MGKAACHCKAGRGMEVNGESPRPADRGEHEAQAIQLQMEYAPAPPFDAGDPNRAPDAVVSDVQERLVKSLAARNAITARVVDRLKLDA